MPATATNESWNPGSSSDAGVQTSSTSAPSARKCQRSRGLATSHASEASTPATPARTTDGCQPTASTYVDDRARSPAARGRPRQPKQPAEPEDAGDDEGDVLSRDGEQVSEPARRGSRGERAPAGPRPRRGRRRARAPAGRRPCRGSPPARRDRAPCRRARRCRHGARPGARRRRGAPHGCPGDRARRARRSRRREPRAARDADDRLEDCPSRRRTADRAAPGDALPEAAGRGSGDLGRDAYGREVVARRPVATSCAGPASPISAASALCPSASRRSAPHHSPTAASDDSERDCARRAVRAARSAGEAPPASASEDAGAVEPSSSARARRTRRGRRASASGARRLASRGHQLTQLLDPVGPMPGTASRSSTERNGPCSVR